MKSLLFVLGVGLGAALIGGCNSASSAPEMSDQQRTAQTTGNIKSIPAPAQNLALQQDQQKRQMDAMRAADAQKTR